MAKSKTSTALVLAPPPLPPERLEFFPLADAWQRHLARLVEAQEMSPRTYTTYQKAMSKFVEWLGEGHTALTREDILGWKAALLRGDTLQKPAAMGTVNTWLSALRSFFTWAMETYNLSYNPAAHIHGASRGTRATTHKRETLTDPEVIRVLAQPDLKTPLGLRDRAILYLMAYTGVRTVEVHQADLANLKNKRGRMVLEVHGKGRQEADEFVVIADAQAQQAMLEWIGARGRRSGPLFPSLSNRAQGQRLSLQAIRHIVKAYFHRAGVQGDFKSTHSLRHTAITNALEHNVPLQKVKSMARHHNIDTTLIYAHELSRLSDPAEGHIDYSPSQKESTDAP